ncbi:short-chain dehydrogenase reductase SDR [Mycena maculata]|uniref:Short-chain dehydrogenase reductase SDR n=1 Tax=Mycena maculata TaxID=230809 RepID=A0AAD7HCQ4_9AGAR|nr:short-chain dehydrogenase reductase SDR [Mycena maculata]
MAAKTIFITGASSGIGLASAKLFHEKGWNVIATMRTPTPDHELSKYQERMLIQRLDLQSFDSIKPAIDEGIKKFFTIDVLLNNAGYGQNGLFEAIPRESVQEQFDVNLFGVMDVTRAILPHFRANGHGGVINVSSGAGFWALPMSTMYSASKFALEGFTEGLSYELASQNIFVKSVVPHGGVTSTKFVDRFRASTATDATISATYKDFTAATVESFIKMTAAAGISSSDVAEIIFTAATDGTNQLRYFIGDDARGFLKARYESKTDEEYMKFMRSYFPKV